MTRSKFLARAVAAHGSGSSPAALAHERAAMAARPEKTGEWPGKKLVDRDGNRLGKLEDVYVDIASGEPMFGTVEEGLFVRHLTFVPLRGITIGRDRLQVTASREEVQAAPNIDLYGDELSAAGESALYRHYQLDYTPPATDASGGRRLARA